MTALVILSSLLGAAMLAAGLGWFLAVHWSNRAIVAEGLLAQAAKRRSEAVSRGNVTRAALQRAKVLETAEQLRLSISGVPLTSARLAHDQKDGGA
jgi:hypothetical protein